MGKIAPGYDEFVTATHMGVGTEGVRPAGGQCVGAFRPKAVGRPIQARHLQYFWDGRRISRYFDYALDRWVALEPPW